METYWVVFQRWCSDNSKENMDEYDFACWMLLQNRIQLEKSAQRFYEAHLKPSEAVGQLLEDMTITFRTLAKGKHPDGLRIDMDWLRSISKNYVERSTALLTPSPTAHPSSEAAGKVDE